MNKLFKLLPSVDALLASVDEERFKREVVRERCRRVLDDIRKEIAAGRHERLVDREQAYELALQRVRKSLRADFAPSLKPVVNATGIILHTGLGRAPLPEAAGENLNRVMRGYSCVELDLESGKRGERTDHVRRLLCELTGAENALLVNNNAAAVFLALNSMAFGKEAIISRGQLIEIGGSFRLPEVMQKSGVVMREVGATNKTKLSDYEKAINENTGVIVVAHTSNYRVLGFTAEVELKALCDLAHAHNIPVLHDLGAGVIVDLRRFGLPYEPLVQDSVAAGADVITFSGDKVLGGPQSGLIVGKEDWLDKIHRNPIMRAVRCDKLIYAAMEATLKIFFTNKVLEEHAVLRMMTEPVKKIRKRAEAILSALPGEVVDRFHIEIRESEGQFGSGALPLERLQSLALVLTPPRGAAESIARQLRTGEPPIVGYIQDDKVWLDMRTVRDEDAEGVVKRLNSLD